MKKFIVIYHAPADAVNGMGDASPEQIEEGMKPWFAWKDELGDQLLDFGTPLAGGTRLMSDGSAEPSTKEVTGYSIIEAKDMEEAKSLLKNHPHLTWAEGCDIEVHESAEIGS